MSIIEDHVEPAALHWFERQGYRRLNGLTIAPGEPAAERTTYADVILAGRLRQALERLNPHLPVPPVTKRFGASRGPRAPR